MRRIISLFTLVTVMLNLPLAAQGVASDPAAPRVRIRQAGASRPTVGIITQIDSDTIHLRAVEGDLAIARSDMTRLDVSRGVHSNAGPGFRKGMWIGAIVGAAMGVMVLADPDEFWYDGGAEIVPLAAAVSGLEGAVIGAGIGALSHSEHWQKSRTDGQTLSLYVAPRQGRTVVGVAMTF
ncbi:MAG TPA: hypothetical protein VFI41_09555 [Gemmatimonadales bacterium]|jgi:hypothetical protein|nr:hypothetical protein [Gemmatimonadales bacterium]